MGRFFLALGGDMQDGKGKKYVCQAMGFWPLISEFGAKFSWRPLATEKNQYGQKLYNLYLTLHK